MFELLLQTPPRHADLARARRIHVAGWRIGIQKGEGPALGFEPEQMPR